MITEEDAGSGAHLKGQEKAVRKHLQGVKQPQRQGDYKKSTCFTHAFKRLKV